MDLETRLARIEAVQHFTMGVQMGIAQACSSNPLLMSCISRSLEQQHAQLLGSSQNEKKLAAFQELLEAVPGMLDGASP